MRLGPRTQRIFRSVSLVLKTNVFNAAMSRSGSLNSRIRQIRRRHYVATCVSVDLPRFRVQLGEKPASVFSVSVDLGRFRVVLKGTLDLLIGVRIPASQLDLPKPLHFVATFSPLAASSISSAFSASANFF